jgi:adenylyl- and sulfurtransferase ThiI
MDGLFSPVATWMSRRDGLAVGAAFTACPQGDPKGCVLLVTFLAQTRKMTRPLPRSLATEYMRKTGEITHKPLLRTAALFRPSLRCDFAQSMIDTGE